MFGFNAEGRWIISAQGWYNLGYSYAQGCNTESVGECGGSLANAFSVVSLLFFGTQGWSNPGLKLANAFGVQVGNVSNEKRSSRLPSHTGAA